MFDAGVACGGSCDVVELYWFRSWPSDGSGSGGRSEVAQAGCAELQCRVESPDRKEVDKKGATIAAYNTMTCLM